MHLKVCNLFISTAAYVAPKLDSHAITSSSSRAFDDDGGGGGGGSRQGEVAARVVQDARTYRKRAAQPFACYFISILSMGSEKERKEKRRR
ncbi:hypothetical protein GUJ93_ZPchr0004g40247 [Zizania palustris]|uniref:Uncharacterized protein n=1 Tax=Zizania palustris TaxID=103762 RepID=A0A8J5SPD9_ZIZPA|nr:hypothetical protein GUJ93_ZPchr0004g40247 [Zizania palustris]